MRRFTRAQVSRNPRGDVQFTRNPRGGAQFIRIPRGDVQFIRTRHARAPIVRPPRNYRAFVVLCGNPQKLTLPDDEATRTRERLRAVPWPRLKNQPYNIPSGGVQKPRIVLIPPESIGAPEAARQRFPLVFVYVENGRDVSTRGQYALACVRVSP